MKDVLSEYKDVFLKSKKYWIIYLVLVLLSSLSLMTMDNYTNPKLELITIILVSVIGVFCILFYQKHDEYDELYKTAFIVILIFGVLCCLLSPIMCAPDEVEHFVRSEMTSRGVIFPEYENGSYLTIQSTVDLMGNSNKTLDTKFDLINTINASILKTDGDTKPINYSLVEYPSAFAQNPFFGYLPQAIGMAIAKLFDSNAIWLLWLGRIFNILLYASFVAFAVKKTSILKVPFFVFSIFPLAMFTVSTVSIDSMVNGLGICAVAYFFYMYTLPKNKLSSKHIAIFSIICLLLGLCKITYFIFILLIFFIPRDTFEDKKLYFKSLIPIVALSLILVCWVKFYANVAFMDSFRLTYWEIHNVNSTEQVSYILTHKKDFLVELFRIPQYLETDFQIGIGAFWFNKFNNLYLLFMGGVCLFYPIERFNIKSRIGALIVCILVYYGTYISLLLAWTPVSQLNEIIGVQLRYFLPLFYLIPFIFGINHSDVDKEEIDSYLVIISISFLVMMILSLVCAVY